MRSATSIPGLRYLTSCLCIFLSYVLTFKSLSNVTDFSFAWIHVIVNCGGEAQQDSPIWLWTFITSLSHFKKCLTVSWWINNEDNHMLKPYSRWLCVITVAGLYFGILCVSEGGFLCRLCSSMLCFMGCILYHQHNAIHMTSFNRISVLCFQMVYRRDVGYYHQVSFLLYFLSLLICILIFRAQLFQLWDVDRILGRYHIWCFSINLCWWKQRLWLWKNKPFTVRLCWIKGLLSIW